MTTSLRGHANLLVEAPYVCYHIDKFGNHGYCDSGYTMFLIVHVTSLNHIFKGL